MSQLIYKKNNTIKLVLLCLLLSSVFVYKKVDAATPINGAMWSSTIGWISASSTGSVSYGLTLNTYNQTITGTAWSDNIGWVSFHSTDIATCPGGSSAMVKYDSNGDLSGYARAIVGSDDQGWDGCINFDSTLAGGTNGANYNATTGLFSGYAWGGVNVGWLSLGGTDDSGGTYGLTTSPTAIPNVTLTASPVSINYGATSTLSWTPVNATGCVGIYSGTDSSDGWAGAQSATAGTHTLKVTPGQTATYNIDCSNSIGVHGFASALVTVSVPPAPISCNPYVTGKIANFANVGQLVTWQTSDGSSATWSGTDVSNSPNPTGPSYSIRYSKIGNKTMVANGTSTCVTGTGSTSLPVINKAGFREF